MDLIDHVMHAISAHADRPRPTTIAAWNPTELVALIDQATKPVTITSAASVTPTTFLGFEFIEDKALPPGVVEIRDLVGNVLTRYHFEVEK